MRVGVGGYTNQSGTKEDAIMDSDFDDDFGGGHDFDGGLEVDDNIDYAYNDVSARAQHTSV